DGQVLAHDQQVGGEIDEAQVIEVLDRVVGQARVGGDGGGVGAHVAEADRVAVGTGVLAAQRAGSAAGTAHVLDHQRLPQDLRHGIAHDARRDVGRPAGGKGDDEDDAALGVGL